MPSKLDDLVLQVEAVLFASGKPLAVKEIADALGLDDYRPVQRAVRTLEQTYGNRQSALEVRRVGDRYALQLQEKFVPTVHSVTPVEMTSRTLRALTLIAYHQPILQSHLVRMIGDVAYEEVQHLRGIGLIHTEPKGSTLELTTTRRFAEYFGIASTRPEEIRRFLEQKLGIAPSVAIPPNGGEEGPTSPSPGAPGEPGTVSPELPTEAASDSPPPDSSDPAGPSAAS
jgi:segregation and condensation protein B